MAEPATHKEQTVHHPIVARMLDRMMTKAEDRGQGEHRVRLLAGLAGRVVEVGAGNGINFAKYPAAVTEVVAPEPEPYLRERARRAAEKAPVKVEVVDAVGQSLPFEDRSFDAGVVSLVLCTVPDQQQALAELYRVIRPGGELRFYEHVVARSGLPRTAMRAGDAVWPHISGGCHMSRDTGAAIEQAGFKIESCERFSFSPAPLQPAVPHILGIARRP